MESILGLDFNEHGKTLYYSIFCPFCYTVGVSHFLFMEGFPYRGKMDIIYTKLWDFERVSIWFIQKYCFHYSLLLRPFCHICLRGLMVRVLAFHSDDPGSIHGEGENFVVFLLLESI